MRRFDLAIWARRGAGILAASIACIATIAPASADPIAVETLFKKPQYGGAVLSPSGRYLAVLVSVKDRRAVAVLDLTANTSKVMPAAGGDAIGVVWQNDDRMLVTIGDLDRATGDRPVASGTWAIDRDGGNSRRVFGSLARVIPASDEILVSAYAGSRSSIELYRENTRNGHHEMLSFGSPSSVVRFVLDFDGVPRAAVTADLSHDKAAWYLRKDADSPWQAIEQGKLNNLNSVPFQFSPDGKILYVNARRGNDRSAVYEYSVDTGKWNGPVVQHPERDIDARFIFDVEGRKLLGLQYADETPKAVWFDQEWATVQKSIDAALPGTTNFLQHRGDRWIITARSDTNPGDVYLLERSTMKMAKLFSYEPWIDPAAMAPTRWVHYPSRDGLSTPALLTVPRGSGNKPVPLIVDIHGGPYVEASDGMYNAEVQFFASRGYAVLRPQYRGTRGFGAKFATAGYRKWGDEMQDDLEDGVKWAAGQGIADPAHVCFFGMSYGGYAALWETIRNPGLIKCAVAYAGVTSIAYMFDNAQTDLSVLAEKSSEMAVEIGDPATDRARFKRVSPLEHADQVGVPIFLAYGLSDLRVPSVHGSEFKSALDKFGKTYELATYSGEAHGLNLDENVFDFYNQVDRFLSKYLHTPTAPGS